MRRLLLLRLEWTGNAFGTACVLVIGTLAALVMAREASAETLFFPSVSYAVGDFPNSVVLADLDGDDILDLAVANPGRSPN
jgi:hypothetical protein